MDFSDFFGAAGPVPLLARLGQAPGAAHHQHRHGRGHQDLGHRHGEPQRIRSQQRGQRIDERAADDQPADTPKEASGRSRA